MLYISPSTQEKNLYPDRSSEEFNMNRLTDDIIKLIRPISVFRNDPKKDALTAIREANQKRAKLHLALHTNAGGGSGVEVFYDPTKPRSKAFAERLAASVSKVLGIPNRGAKDGRHLLEIRAARKDMDAVLAELFFHDNPADVAKFRANYSKLVNEQAWQIKVYFGVK
ncbi:MAG: N-acetylmuramoyl-L-alanine amidase [Carboxydocellales bacterium]